MNLYRLELKRVCKTRMTAILLAIALVNRLVVSDKFKIFAYYTLIAGTVVVALGIYEQLSGHALQQAVIALMG